VELMKTRDTLKARDKTQEIRDRRHETRGTREEKQRRFNKRTELQIT